MEYKKRSLTTSLWNNVVWGRKILMAGMMIFALGWQTGCNNEKEINEILNANLHPVDRAFVLYAAQSNLAEATMGQLALEKSQDSTIRNFAQQMINEHTAAQSQLKSIGDHNNIRIPDQLDQEHEAIGEQLSILNGQAFDRAYINNQVTSHQRTSANMQIQIQHGEDNNLKSYATAMKPQVDDHLVQAMQIKADKGF